MKFFNLAGEKASRVAQGCMRIAGMGTQELDMLLKQDLELGINFFDHADIYGGGKSEEVFGKLFATEPSLREKMFLQPKRAIRSGFFDFSKEYILQPQFQSTRQVSAKTLLYL